MIKITESGFDNVQKYAIVALTDYGELGKTVYTSDPKKAIETWFKLQKDYPISVSIDASSKEDALLLLQSASSDFIEVLYSKYRCPYKKEFLINEIANGIRFFNGKEGEADSVHPFSVG